ncbi:MAG: glycosyl hydrolase family 5 [Ferruginibacter sp.]|nr:glycosyl hydrolase family 5 [Ferruginibacter sp.]
MILIQSKPFSVKNHLQHLTQYCFFLLLFSSFLFSLPCKSQGFLKAEGKRIVNEKGKNVLLRGMGLGGWMLQEGYMLHVPGPGQQHKIRERIAALLSPQQTQEFYDVWLANHTRRIDVDSMHAWGFNSVRLPMHYNLYTLPIEAEPVAGENTWLTKGFALTDSLLAWCKANKMYLILDLHAAPGGQGNDLNISDRDETKPSLWASAANQQKTIALWKKLAERYANEPWIGGYDILNEPNFGFTDSTKDKNGTQEKKNEPLKQLMTDITRAIRSVDKKHIVIIEGNGWGNNYNGILPVWDDNMVLSFHKYWNYNDQQSIAHIISTRDKYNIPVWLGETGENSNVWFTQAIRLLESNNIGWAWWPLKKIGFNNPLEIKSNLNYDDLLSYWNGKGKQPKESNVYSGLLELATYTRLEANVFHKDVIDAMMRQPFSTEALPYQPNVIRNGSILQAAEYDLGRNGVAYYDKDTADYHVSGKRGVGNRGRSFRNDGVDIRKDSSQYERYYVSDTEAGEWLQYTLNVPAKGVYTLKIETAAEIATGIFSISVGNEMVAKEIPVPNTGALNKWQFIEVKNVALGKGRQTLKFYVEMGGFNVKSISFFTVR